MLPSNPTYYNPALDATSSWGSTSSEPKEFLLYSNNFYYLNEALSSMFNLASKHQRVPFGSVAHGLISTYVASISTNILYKFLIYSLASLALSVNFNLDKTSSKILSVKPSVGSNG